MGGDRFDILRELFLVAIELDGDERAAFIERYCQDDEELRADLDSLLATAKSGEAESDRLSDDHIAQVRSGLDRAFEGAALPHASLITRAEFARTDGEALGGDPEAIGRYRIIRRIASGGMGTVWKAEQDSPKRIVALKTLHLHRSTGALSARLQREWEILGRLQHPGIAQVYDAGLVDMGEGGQPFFAMEFIDGQPLTKYADVQDLDDRQRLELLALACDAVHYAHERGIVHRDLKPDNIMVDGHGRPKVLDFGIARIASESIHDFTTMTRDGQILGTLSYMAPEQMDGNPDGVSARSDVYALGVVGFELLAGRLPHDVTSMSIAGALKVLTSHDPPKMDSVDTRFRGDVQTIIGAALEREPERRYASAAALAADIRRYLAHRPIKARPPSAIYQARKFVSRHRTLVAGTTATMLVLIAGVIVALSLAAAEREQRKLANDLADSEREQRQIATESETLARRNNIKAMRGLYAGAQLLQQRGETWEAVNQLNAIDRDARRWEWKHVALRLPWVLDDQAYVRNPNESWIASSRFFNDHEFLQYTQRAESAACFAYDLRTDERRVLHAPDVELKSTAFWPHAPSDCIAIRTADDEIGVLNSADDSYERLPFAWQQSVEQVGRLSLNEDATLVASWVHNVHRLSIYDADEEVFGLESGLKSGGMQWTHAQFLRSRPYVILSRWGGLYFVVDTRDWSIVAQRSVPSSAADARVGVSADESSLYIATNNGIERFSIPALELEGALVDAFGPLEMAVISPDGQRIAATSRGEQEVYIFRVRDGELLYQAEMDQPHFSSPPTFSRDGRFLCYGHTPWIIDVDEPAEPAITTLEGHASWIYQLAASPDGSLLASAAPEGRIVLWDLERGRMLTVIERVHGGSATAHNMNAPLVFSPDGRTLLFAELDEAKKREGLTRIDLDTGERSWTALANRHAVLDAIASEMPPGQTTPLFHHACMLTDGRIVEGSAHQNSRFGARVRRPGETGTPPVDLSSGQVSAGVAANPDGSTYATGEYLTIRIRDPKTQEILHELPHGVSDRSWGVAYSPDGSRFAVGKEDGRIVIYDTEFFEKLCDVYLPPVAGQGRNYVFSLIWTPDGSRLVTAGAGNVIRILESQRPFQRDHRAKSWSDQLRRARKLLADDSGAAPAAPDELQAALRIARIEQWAASTTNETPAAE